MSGETTVNSSPRDSSSGPGPVADFTPTNMETEMEKTEVSDEGELGDPSLVEDHLSNSDRLHRSAALLLLTAKECYQLTQSASNIIVHQIQQMMSFAVDDIGEIITEYLTSQGTSVNIPELEAQLEAMRNPFVSLKTEYMQNKFYRENFNLVVRYLILLCPLILLHY